MAMYDMCTTFIAYTTKTEVDYRFTSTLGERPKKSKLFTLLECAIYTHA